MAQAGSSPGNAGGKGRVRSGQVTSHHGLPRFVSLQDFRPVRGGTRVYVHFEGFDPCIAEFKPGNDSGFPNRLVQVKDPKAVLYPHGRPSAGSAGGGSAAHDAAGTRGVAFGVGPGSSISSEEAEKLLDAAYDREIEHKHPGMDVPREIGRIQWPTVRMLQDPGIRVPVVYSLDKKPQLGTGDVVDESSGTGASSDAPKILRFTVLSEGQSAPESTGEAAVSGERFSVKKGEEFVIAYKVSDDADHVSIDPLGSFDEKEGEIKVPGPPEERTAYTLIAQRGTAKSVCHFTVAGYEGTALDVTREKALFKEEIPLAETEYAELALEIQVKGNGTLQLWDVEGASKEEWLERLRKRLKEQCKDLIDLLNPTFAIQLNGFHFEGFRPEITRTSEGYEIKCKLLGAFEKPKIDLEATVILVSTDSEHGKTLWHGPKGEFVMARQVLDVLPEFEVVPGKAVCKDFGLTAEIKLLIEPRWTAIARWLASEAGMEAVLTVAFFGIIVAVYVEAWKTIVTILEWRNLRSRIPDFADRYAQGYMDALDGKTGPGDPHYHQAWEAGWRKSHEAEEKAGSWTAYMDWMQQHRGEVEASVRRQSLDLAKRSAWEQYNAESRSFQDQRGAWLWIYDKDPVAAGQLKLFQDFCSPSAPDYFKSGSW